MHECCMCTIECMNQVEGKTLFGHILGLESMFIN